MEHNKCQVLEIWRVGKPTLIATISGATMEPVPPHATEVEFVPNVTTLFNCATAPFSSTLYKV